MFSWINHADPGNALTSLVSGGNAEAIADRMLGSVTPRKLSALGEVELSEKSGNAMFRVIPWTENAVRFRGPTSDGFQQEDNVLWPAYAAAVQLQDPQSTVSAASKLDSVPATPPLLSDSGTLVSPLSSTDCDKVVELSDHFATFIESLPQHYAPTINEIQCQYSFGNNSTCPATDTVMVASIRPKLESMNSETQIRSLHSPSAEEKDDQVKKILSKCGKWTQTATMNKSVQWTSVGLEKPKVQAKSRRADHGPATQHQRTSRARALVPSEKAEHVQRERDRRIQLRAMYKTLDSLIPAHSRTAKRDRTTIVNDSLNYVKEMRKKLEKLEAYKAKSVMALSLSELMAKNVENRNHQVLNTSTGVKLSFPATCCLMANVNRLHAVKEVEINDSETRSETSGLSAKPEIHVFTASGDEVLIDINSMPRRDLISRILKALEVLQLDVFQYTFSKICDELINCHFAAKIRSSTDTVSMTETIKAVLGDLIQST